jgi:hypothetical protein
LTEVCLHLHLLLFFFSFKIFGFISQSIGYSFERIKKKEDTQETLYKYYHKFLVMDYINQLSLSSSFRLNVTTVFRRSF